MGDVAGLLIGVGFLILLAIYIAFTACTLAHGDDPDTRTERGR